MVSLLMLIFIIVIVVLAYSSYSQRTNNKKDENYDPIQDYNPLDNNDDNNI